MKDTYYNPETHIGAVDEEIYPSVTQTIGEEKLSDYSMVDPAILARKRMLGVRVHHCCELLDNCRLDWDDVYKNYSELIPYLEAYLKFREIEHFEPILKETRLFSFKWKFHGAMDEVSVATEGKYGGRLCVIDYKCLWQMFESAGAQMAAYEILVKENYNDLGLPAVLKRKKFHKLALQLKSNGNYQIHEYNKPEYALDFHACLRLHWRRRTTYKTVKIRDEHEAVNHFNK